MSCGSKPVNAGQRHSPTPKNSQQEHQQELRCEITRLANKVAIVTGAGTRSQNVSGVGVAPAKAFADQGAKILIVDIDETAAQITESAITEAGGEASIYVADVAHESGCRQLVEAAVESYGKLDILMNSVGIARAIITDPELIIPYWNRCTSDPQMPEYLILTSTWFGPGSGVGISSTAIC